MCWSAIIYQKGNIISILTLYWIKMQSYCNIFVWTLWQTMPELNEYMQGHQGMTCTHRTLGMWFNTNILMCHLLYSMGKLELFENTWYWGLQYSPFLMLLLQFAEIPAKSTRFNAHKYRFLHAIYCSHFGAMITTITTILGIKFE